MVVKPSLCVNSTTTTSAESAEAAVAASTFEQMEQLDQLYATIDNTLKMANKHDYHLHHFLGESKSAESIVDARVGPKIATIKERVVALLTDPGRKMKKNLQRREIFMVTLFLCQNLNCRHALSKSHISAKSRELIKTLWESILPSSLTEYIHNPEIIVKFSAKASTSNAKMELLKTYFDSYLEEICAAVTNNLEIIRYIYSMTYPEVYFQSDIGLKMHNKMSDLMNAVDEATTTVAPEKVEQKRLVEHIERRMNRYSPYDVIKRIKNNN